MRAITIIAIIAAAAAGIIAGTILLVIPITRSVESENEQREPVMDEVPGVSGYRQVNVTVNGVDLIADIAESQEQRSKGLTVKDSLAENGAMLFVFKEPDRPAFWMPPEMKFPIDIIWISEHHEVVHIEHSLEPCISDSFCPSYKPDRNSLYVLETMAGFAQKYNVTENTYVDFQLDES